MDTMPQIVGYPIMIININIILSIWSAFDPSQVLWIPASLSPLSAQNVTNAIPINGPGVNCLTFSSNKRGFWCDMFGGVDALETYFTERPVNGNTVTVDKAVSFEGMGDDRDMLRPIASLMSEEHDGEKEVLEGVRSVVLGKNAVTPGLRRL